MAKRIPTVIFLMFIAGLLAGCSQQIARVRIQSEGAFEESFKHNGSPVTLWTDLDIEYIVSTNLLYEIKVLKNGDLVDTLICNPFDVSMRMMARRAVIRGVTKESYLAPMNCIVELPAGEITLQVDFLAVGGDVRVFRADLVVNKKADQ